jgi:hypothetical protein
MDSPSDDFHPEAHPDAREITGHANYGKWGQCIVQAKSTDKRCRGHAQGPHGKCRHHGGATPTAAKNPAVGNGEQDDNTNRITHGAYTAQKKLYAEEFSVREVDLADWIFDDYIELYVTRHGHEPPAGFRVRLFNVAVNVVTEMRVENWYTDKPDELDTGTPHIDREKHVSEQGQTYYRYKKSPALPAMKHLSDYNHKWLKSFSLLPDAETQQAYTMGSVLTILADEARSDSPEDSTEDSEQKEVHAHGNS